MAFPKWKYRKHPLDGYFQATLVLTEVAESELETNWSDDPADTGFQVRPAAQAYESHVTDIPLFEVITDASNPAVEATLDLTLVGDING